VQVRLRRKRQVQLRQGLPLQVRLRDKRQVRLREKELRQKSRLAASNQALQLTAKVDCVRLGRRRSTPPPAAEVAFRCGAIAFPVPSG
jgi:hypothetical protein